VKYRIPLLAANVTSVNTSLPSYSRPFFSRILPLTTLKQRVICQFTHTHKYLSKYLHINSHLKFTLNKSPTRCNSMQSDLFHCKVTLHVSGITAPITRSTKNCNRSLRYRSYCETQGLTGMN